MIRLSIFIIYKIKTLTECEMKTDIYDILETATQQMLGQKVQVVCINKNLYNLEHQSCTCYVARIDQRQTLYKKDSAYDIGNP